MRLRDNQVAKTADRSFATNLRAYFAETLNLKLRVKGYSAEDAPPYIVVKSGKDGAINDAIDWTQAASKPLKVEERWNKFQSIEDVDQSIPGFSKIVASSFREALQKTLEQASRATSSKQGRP